MITKKEFEKLTKIALKNIASLEERTDLKTHNCDAEDFFETSVWTLREVLIEAYELGKKSK